MDLLIEIAGDVDRMRHSAATAGTRIMAPLLVLGTSERVGSNWLSDTLRAALPQHNEPLRQQIGAAHPISALNPNPVGLDALTDAQLGVYGRHWLASFAVSKYSPVRQVVKETNLYFTVGTLLRLLPDAPIVVASRSPLGVASSFARSGLWQRWDYPARYRQLVAMTQTGPRARWALLVPDDDPTPLSALTRMVVLNTLLLAAAVDGRPMVHVSYEDAVADHTMALAAVRALAGSDTTPPTGSEAASRAADDTFATTNAKTGLIAHLDAGAADLVVRRTARLLDAARSILPTPVVDTAAGWLAGAHRYRLDGSVTSVRRVTPAPRPATAAPVIWITLGPLTWRNLLVSNAEYAAFLTTLADAGLANTTAGTHLLAIPMPAGRGGRLHSDAAGRWHVEPGYEQHPVYWVTWIGAAAYAAFCGARLPRRVEMVELIDAGQTADSAVNADYRVGDVVPVTMSGTPADQIHHPVGNVQVWCADGPHAAGLHGGPAARFLHGAAWNTPASIDQIHQPRHRHLSGASRGVGIRLVRDGDHQPAPASELAVLLRTWIASLADRSQPLGVHDAGLLAVLSGLPTRRLQPDLGLRSGVGPRTGEPSVAQLSEPLREPQ